MTTPPEPRPRPVTLGTGQVLVLAIGGVVLLSGQILQQSFSKRPWYESGLPTLGGLLLILIALAPSLWRGGPGAVRRLDPAVSPLSLYLSALVLSLTAGLVAGPDRLLRLPALSIGLWIGSILIVLFASSAIRVPSGSMPRWDFAAVLLLIAGAAAARLVLLGQIPWVLSGDEASVGLSARDFLDGVWSNPFGVAWYSFPSLFFLLPAASIRFLGQTIEALRLPAALAGTATVGALFFYSRRTFGRALAVLAAAYLAFFHFHIHFSRIALNNIWDAFFITALSYLLWRAWTEARPALLAWAGVIIGLSLYFYTSTRILLVLVPAWMVVAFLRDRRQFRRVGNGWLVMAAAAAVVMLPLAVFFILHPDEFLAPMVRVSILGPWLTHEIAVTGLPAWRILANQMVTSASAFTVGNLRSWYVLNHPMLLPIPAALFLVGLVIALRRALDLRYTWLLLWLAATIVVGGLSESAPAAQRYILAAPVVAILVALPLAELLGILPSGNRVQRIVSAVGVGAILLAAVFFDMRFYFTDYTPSRRFSDRNTEMAQDLGLLLSRTRVESQGGPVYFFGQSRITFRSISTLPYLAPGVEGIDVNSPLTSPPEWDVRAPAAFVFLPDDEADPPQVERAYPGGQVIARFAANGDLLYTVYLLE
jgi:4-amino-4-deoxy-L-arabinose transferase-like glycosyltransferase